LGAGGIWLGCGGDDTTTVPGTDAGTDVTSNPDTGKPDTGTDTGTPDTGTPDTGTDAGFVFDGSAPLNCASYCANNLGVCTGPGNGQYLDLPTCLAMCAKFPVGDAGNTAGNTLGCRAYHTGLAAQSAGNAKTHCPHAGPYGAGVCGSENENFCTLYNAQCGAADYGVNCPSQGSFGGLTNGTQDGGFISVLAGNTKDCREYHLEAAYQGNVGPDAGHCLHADKAGGGVCQ
jgi:hypothetical protein